MDLTVFNNYEKLNEKSERNQLKSPLDSSNHANEDKHLIGESLPSPIITPSQSAATIGESPTPAREDHSHGDIPNAHVHEEDHLIPDTVRVQTNGSSSNPSLQLGSTFPSSQNVGLFRSGNDLGFSASGTTNMYLDEGHNKIVAEEAIYPHELGRRLAPTGTNGNEGASILLSGPGDYSGISFAPDNATLANTAYLYYDRVNAWFNFAYNNGTSFVALRASAFTVTSSREFKEDIEYNSLREDSLAKHLTIKTASWQPKDSPVGRKRGFILEDLKEAYPDVTLGKHYDTVGLTSHLWDTVTTLILKVQELEDKLNGKLALDGS